MKITKYALLTFLLGISTVYTSCKSQVNSNKTTKKSAQILPFSDQTNTGNWVLNTDVSDEFDAKTIDEDKWYIVGKFENAKPVYKDPDYPNKKVSKARPPSQFSGRNYYP